MYNPNPTLTPKEYLGFKIAQAGIIFERLKKLPGEYRLAALYKFQGTALSIEKEHLCPIKGSSLVHTSPP